MYTYEYPRPALTADIVLFNLDRTELLLIRRGNEPYKDHWAFPGGFFDMTDPNIEYTAARELQEETGLANIPLQMVYVASREGRDPRGRTVSVIFTANVDPSTIEPRGGDDAAEARWWPVDALPPLAFDHNEVLEHII
ncbi:MAG: NUDIX hydrolase [Bacteroidales bacterium]|nr:NUDIX hydrolase [Bacteroidales bacterium]